MERQVMVVSESIIIYSLHDPVSTAEEFSLPRLLTEGSQNFMHNHRAHAARRRKFCDSWNDHQ